MEDQVAGVVVILIILCGAFVLVWAMYGRQRLRELAMRERLALIERGLVPSPETNPAAFERLLGFRRAPNAHAVRYRSAGVLLMGVGAGLFVLIAFASGSAEVGFGVGGAIAALGFAAFLNGTLLARDEPHSTIAAPAQPGAAGPPAPAVAAGSREVPPNIAP